MTLVELIIVIAIVAILAALVTPLTQSWIGRSQSAVCLGKLRQIGAALQLYLADHNMTMPVMAAVRLSSDDPEPAMDTVLATYAGNDPRIFACPSDPTIAKASGTSYHWNNALNGQNVNNMNFLGFIKDLTQIPLMADKEGWHRYSERKVNFLYADGHAANEFKLFTIP